MSTVVRNFNSFPAFFNELVNEAKTNNDLPHANITETDDQFVVSLAVAGFQKEDFKLELDNRNLKVSVVKDEQKDETPEKFIRKEFTVKSFERSFKLPISADTEAINAIYENGILNITIAKKEEAKPKEPRLISIN